MNHQEKRWFNNLKKAFYESDNLYSNLSDKCMEELCKAIDIAQKLRLSLSDEPVNNYNNKKKYEDFLELEIPGPNSGGLLIHLVDARTGEKKDYTFPSLVYAIRCCMLHENENLNASEKPDYHIQLDWQMDPNCQIGGRIIGDRVVCNAGFMWMRLRQILAKFITGLDSKISFAQDKTFNISICPDLGSIAPD